jgi:thiol:disulfide interchange protein
MKIVKPLILAALLSLAAGTAHSADRAIYPDPGQARADLAAALKTAATTHRRILLDFGGDWCGDCQVLNLYFHDARNKPILDANFVLVDINIGNMDSNLDIAEKYGVPIAKGVPALAVLDANGTVLYSQKTGQFNSMRNMDPGSVNEFLNHWKG